MGLCNLPRPRLITEYSWRSMLPAGSGTEEVSGDQWKEEKIHRQLMTLGELLTFSHDITHKNWGGGGLKKSSI